MLIVYGDFIKINGKQMPYPKKGVAIKESNIVNAGRNANAVVTGEKVGRTQFKIEGLVFPYLPALIWDDICSATQDNYLEVETYFPSLRRRQILKMYPSDRVGYVYNLDSNDEPEHYYDCSFNLIDIGEDIE